MTPVLTLFVLSLLASPVWSFFSEESLTARSAFLLDLTTGQVLYQREPDLPLPPASTTKIVTAIVALESNRRGKDLLSVTKTATRVPSSKLYLRPGQTMSVEDLLYGLLLSSANDASLVLAEGIAGSVERFAEMMTDKAREIGAANSHFTNPHGLTAPEHYSTARDMALLFNYAMKNPTFREIVQTKTSSVSSISAGKVRKVRHIQVRNHNRLLWSFEGAIGGKTGYTHAAQKCFVGAVSRNGVTLIVSMLGSRDLWGDTRRLLEYGLENYETLRVAARPAAPSRSGGQVAFASDKPSTPLLSWEEEKAIHSVNGYLLQVASFRERERAESLQKSITEGGYPSFLEQGSLHNGETTYRVRIGPYPELSDAQEAAREIENKSGFRAIIIPPAAVTPSPEKPS
ncbi:MAG: D-alanyl-D-alanine carboxypeptidase [Deltaproteobacteria bacterium]|nr:D-alanyl-D-alanine carboxypeptidase [Deltaproteobacteria bacterium]